MININLSKIHPTSLTTPEQALRSTPIPGKRKASEIFSLSLSIPLNPDQIARLQGAKNIKKARFFLVFRLYTQRPHRTKNPLSEAETIVLLNRLSHSATRTKNYQHCLIAAMDFWKPVRAGLVQRDFFVRRASLPEQQNNPENRKRMIEAQNICLTYFKDLAEKDPRFLNPNFVVDLFLNPCFNVAGIYYAEPYATQKLKELFEESIESFLQLKSISEGLKIHLSTFQKTD